MIAEELYKKILLNMSNLYSDNYDYYRYGRLPLSKRIGFWLLSFLKTFNLIYFGGGKHSLSKRIERIESNFDGLNFLYKNLKDNSSREVLIQVLLFRILGNYRYKLNVNNPNFFEATKYVQSLKISNEFKKAIAGERERKFHKYDLSSIGFDIKIFFVPNGIVSGFIWKQYEYNSLNVEIKANPGDIVIDAGGCYGDTALYFGALVGDSGKVYSFEFIPNNIQFLESNLKINPTLEKRISLVERPLWSSENLPVFYKDNGPGSKVSFERFNDSDESSTYTIDGLRRDERLDTIDFIKMDIEGAELHALQGALNTIKTCKPKLAISIYHRISDFGDITRKILEINPSYKLYLNHYTIHTEETILYAINED